VLRLAVESDIERIVPHRENLFDTEAQVPEWVRCGWTYVLDEGTQLVGVGLCSPVWPGTPQRDIGVMVHPAKRGLGHGQRIVASLAEHCLRQDLVPTAGCAHDNVASQRTLLRAGFISRHSLIEFQLGSSAR
jgi:RimJ/RimL family protein N-acetyltransferase